MSRLYLVRHGETDWNAQRRYQGYQDIPLNDKGKSQAKTLGEMLREMPLKAIYSSPLKRAAETAMIVNNSRENKLPYFTLQDLKEGSFGVSFEGKLISEIQKQYSDVFAKHRKMSNTEKMHSKWNPGMESPFEIIERVLPILRRIGSKHLDEEVLIVSHGGVIRSLLMHLFDIDWNSLTIDNGEIISFDFDGQAFTGYFPVGKNFENLSNI